VCERERVNERETKVEGKLAVADAGRGGERKRQREGRQSSGRERGSGSKRQEVG